MRSRLVPPVLALWLLLAVQAHDQVTGRIARDDDFAPMQGIPRVHPFPICPVFQAVFANVLELAAAHFVVVRAGHFGRLQAVALPPMPFAPTVLHDIPGKAFDAAMIEVQWLTPSHAPSIPCLFHHFPGQPRRVGHNDVVMVPPQNFTRHLVHGAILRHHDPLRTLDAVLVAKTVQLLHSVGKIPVSPGKVIGSRMVFIIVGICNREIAGAEVRVYQQNEIAARFAETNY